MTMQDYVAKFNENDVELYQNELPNSRVPNWMQANIPVFACSDKTIEETYYFRYWTYRKHIRKTPEGHVVTEFLPTVPWSGQYNAIVCPVAHQINEGRWLADRSFLHDYIRHFAFGDPELTKVYLYQNGFISAVCDYVLSFGELVFGEELFPALLSQYEFLKQKHATEYGLYWCIDNYDGMEYSISGNGLRPTINAYLCGDAYELSRLAEALHKANLAESLMNEHLSLKKAINETLWNKADAFFETVHAESQSDAPDFDFKDAAHHVKEAIGFVPFAYHAADADKVAAFRYLEDPSCFAAPFGPTTADQSHPLFNKNPVDHECLWDGPSWPYATTQILDAMIAVLKASPTPSFSPESFVRLLRQYASCHYRDENGRRLNWIDENLDPFTGQWLARKILLTADWVNRNEFIPERGKDYNHSAFCNPVISGLCGITLESAGDDKVRLRILPQLDDSITAFSLEHLKIKGHDLCLYYDAACSASSMLLKVDGTAYPIISKDFSLILG